MDEVPSFEKPLELTARSMPRVGLSKIKLLLRRNVTKLEKAKAELRVLTEILSMLAQFREQKISSFELLDFISQGAEELPEGNLKDRTPGLKWKYLIQLGRSLRYLKDNKEEMCELIIQHDLAKIVTIFENIKNDVTAQIQLLENINARATHQIEIVLLFLRKKFEELNNEAKIMESFSSLIESLSMLAMDKSKKKSVVDAKIEEIREFCLSHKGNACIDRVYNQIFVDEEQVNLEKLSENKQVIRASAFKLETQLASLQYRINLITLNEEPLVSDTRILNEIREKIKKLITGISSQKPQNPAEILSDLVILKAHLLRLSGEKERGVADLSPRENRNIVSLIHALPDEVRMLRVDELQRIDASIVKLLGSLANEPYKDDLEKLKDLWGKLFVLNASLNVGLQNERDGKQLIPSLTREIKHIQQLFEAISLNESEGRKGLITNLPGAKRIFESISDIFRVKDPEELLRLTARLLPELRKLFIEAALGKDSEVDFILFDIHKSMVGLLKKNCIEEKDDSLHLAKMILTLKELALKLPDEPEYIKIKDFLSKLVFDAGLNIVELLKLVTAHLHELEPLKKIKKNPAFSQLVNKLAELQKHIFSMQALCVAIGSTANFYSEENPQLWQDRKLCGTIKGLSASLGDPRPSIFSQRIKELYRFLNEVQAYKTLVIEKSKKRGGVSLLAINAFIGHEYDKANIDVVIKYLTILLKKRPNSQASRAALLATLLVTGEAFKDLSFALRKRGFLKNWYSFYAMRNAIHSILGSVGRKKFEYLLKTFDPITERLFDQCYQDLIQMRLDLIRIRESIPEDSALIEAVRTELGSEVTQPRKESIEVNLPSGLKLLHAYLTGRVEFNLEADQLTVVELKPEDLDSSSSSEVEQDNREAFVAKLFTSHKLGGLIQSIQAEAQSLHGYCTNFDDDPETFSLACEFSVAYCGDIVRKLLDDQDYCDHLSEHFLERHYFIKAERGDLMHDRVLKAKKFDKAEPRYLWIADQLAPCAFLAMCSMRLSDIGNEFLELVESDFIHLNQSFNRAITSHFNGVKFFLENLLGKAAVETLRQEGELDEDLIASALFELNEGKKLALLESINFLLSDFPYQMNLQFEEMKNKWVSSTNLKFDDLAYILDELLNINLFALQKGLNQLQKYSHEIIHVEASGAKQQLSEQEKESRRIIERHEQGNFERNIGKFTYFRRETLETVRDLLVKAITSNVPQSQESVKKEKGSLFSNKK